MKKILLPVLLLLVASAAYADTVYNNTGAVSGGGLSPFGNPNSSTYGQSFSAPGSDTVLNSFSLFLNGGSTGQLEGYVATWTGTQAGSILYTSAPVTVTGSNQEFDFNTGGLSLTPGGSYVAFLSISEPDYNGYVGTTSMPTTTAGTVPGGHFEWINNYGDASQFTSTAWDSETWGVVTSSSYDAEFEADFSSPVAAPEPSSLMLLGSGLAGFLGVMRRKLSK